MAWSWDITLGDTVAAVLSVTAIGLATWQLVTSRRDLINERRADFRAGLLEAIAVTLEHSGKNGDASVAARLRFLPPEWDMPVLRAWAKAPRSGTQEINAMWEAAGSPEPPDEPPLIGWVRQEGRQEIGRAAAMVMEEQPGRHGWWSRAWATVRSPEWRRRSSGRAG